MFFKQAILNYKQTGALFSSSRFLSKKMTLPLFQKKNQKNVIELGPGNGTITKKILKSIDKNSKLMVFELNAVFCEELRKINDSRLVVINDSATNILKYIDTESVDFIISSLPLAHINLQTKKEILTQINKVLIADGSYIQYQYSLLDYSFLKDNFKNVKVGFTLFNLPPAFIYNCEPNADN